jgi:hypothetical protein
MVRSASSRVSNHESPDTAILRDAASRLLRMRSVGATYLPLTTIPTPIASTLKNIAAVDSQPSQYSGPAIT